MPWFAPIVKKSSSAPLSQPQPYHHDHHSINTPPPSAVARKIKEQGWYNSIKAKASSSAPPPAPPAPAAFVSTPLGVADSPLRARQPSANASLPFLRSQKSRHAPPTGSSRRPTTPPNADDLRASSNPKLATLNKKNLHQHNHTITIVTSPGPQPSAGTTRPEPADEFGHFQNSVRSIAGSTARQANWKNTPLLPQHSHPSLLIQQTQAPSSTPAHDFEVATQSLAIRLQELATANQDGLLDDEEYRALRQGLFDRMTANNTEPSVIDIAPTPYESFPNTASTMPSSLNEQQCPSPHLLDPATCPTPLSPTRPAPSLRRSLRSTASTTSFIQSLFKRQTRWLRAKTVTSDSEDGPFVEEPEFSPISPHHPSDPPPLLTRPLHHRPEIHGHASASNLPSQSVSQGGCSQSMTSSASPSETSSSPARPKQANSSRSSSTYSKTSRMLNGATTTTVVATADQPHTSATAMRREISDLEYERGRVLETFDEMERAVIVRWRGHEGTGDSGEALLDSPQGRPQSFLAPLPGAATLRAGTRQGRSRGMKAFPPPVENEMRGMVEESSESGELEKEIEEIRKKRKAVEDRYADRLEYLNAKLKGAMIRERTKAR